MNHLTVTQSAYWVSTRWSGSARTNINSVVIVRILFSPHKERARRPSSTLDLLASLVVLGGTMEVNGGPLRDSFEHHVTVPDLTAPVVQRERIDSVHTPAFTKDIAVVFDLQQERPSHLVFTVFARQVLQEEDASFV